MPSNEIDALTLCVLIDALRDRFERADNLARSTDAGEYYAARGAIKDAIEHVADELAKTGALANEGTDAGTFRRACGLDN